MIEILSRAPGLRRCRFTAGEPETLFYRRFTVLAQRGYAAEPVRVGAQRTVGSHTAGYMVCMHLHRHSAYNLFGGEHVHTSKGYGRPWAIAPLWVISLWADMHAFQTAGRRLRALLKAAPARLFLWPLHSVGAAIMMPLCIFALGAARPPRRVRM